MKKYIYLCFIKQQKTSIMTTLKETQETMQEWIDEIIFDLQQDWNDDKERMGTQLGLLIQAKANLDAIEKMGGQIFKSSIKLG